MQGEIDGYRRMIDARLLNIPRKKVTMERVPQHLAVVGRVFCLRTRRKIPDLPDAKNHQPGGGEENRANSKKRCTALDPV